MDATAQWILSFITCAAVAFFVLVAVVDWLTSEQCPQCGSRNVSSPDEWCSGPWRCNKCGRTWGDKGSW